MKHQSKEHLKKQNRLIAIAQVKGLLLQDNPKDAIDISIRFSMTPQQFGLIGGNLDKTAQEIYNIIY